MCIRDRGVGSGLSSEGGARGVSFSIDRSIDRNCVRPRGPPAVVGSDRSPAGQTSARRGYSSVAGRRSRADGFVRKRLRVGSWMSRSWTNTPHTYPTQPFRKLTDETSDFVFVFLDIDYNSVRTCTGMDAASAFASKQVTYTTPIWSTKYQVLQQLQHGMKYM